MLYVCILWRNDICRLAEAKEAQESILKWKYFILPKKEKVEFLEIIIYDTMKGKEKENQTRIPKRAAIEEETDGWRWQFFTK